MVSFMLNPVDIEKFVENQTDYSMAKTDELNEDEIIEMRKHINELPPTLTMISAAPEMLQVCGSVAEYTFYDICEIVDFHGIIYSRVKARHAKERAMNMDIHDIENEIGKSFHPDKARDVIEKIVATLTNFGVENLHSTVRDISVNQWGMMTMKFVWKNDPDSFRYIYHLNNKYRKPVPPDMDLLDDVFDVCHDVDNHVYLLDNSATKETIIKMVESVVGLEVESINSCLRNCFITKTRYGEEVTELKRVFVIESISVSSENVIGVLDQCKYSKTLIE